MAVANLLAQSVPIAVPPDVHPVPSPALAVAGVGEEPVDDLRFGIRRTVGKEGLALATRRRQADQVEGNPTEPEVLAHRRARRQAAGLVAGGEKGVDRVAGPGLVGRTWDRGT